MERHPAPDSIDALVGHAAGRRRGTIVVVDVVESVRLMEQDEAGAVARWQALVDAVVRGVLPGSGGRLVKSLGDGMMLAFDDAPRAITAAFAVQRASARLDEAVPRERRTWLRIGAHSGEHFADGLDVYGRDVNLAARLTTLAGPGEIVISAQVREQVVDTLDGEIEDLGECYLKHIEQPVRAFRIGPPGPEPVIERHGGEVSLRPVVAVIPFDGRGITSDQAVLGEVIAEGLINALSQSQDLDVISRMSTTLLAGRGEAASVLARRIGADYIVTGHCRTAGARTSVTAELCEVRTARVVWTETMHARLADVVWGTSPMFETVVERIRTALLSRALELVRTNAMPTLETYTLMLAAVASMYRLSTTDFDRARLALEAVADRAPRHPTPRAWLAQWYVLRWVQGRSPDPAADASRAADHSRRALDLDPYCALALAIDGVVETHFKRRFDVAAERFELALASNPNEPMALANRGVLHAFADRGSAAMRDTLRAGRLSPIDPLRFYFDSLAGTAALSADEPTKALQYALRSYRANRLHASTLRVLIVANWRLGHMTEARQAVSEMRALDPAMTVDTWLARSPIAERPLGRLIAQAMRESGLPA
jgi:class 3 adenylate cyclase/TolB-like protein